MNIRYDPSKATLSPSAIESLVRIRIGDFSTENLQKFGKNFRLSKFSTYIDDINPTISSNTVDIKLQKRFEPRLGNSSPYTLRFDTPLFHPIDGYPSILESTGFGYQDSTSSSVVKPNVDCYLDDDGFGNARIYKFVGTNKVYISESAGTIDYNKGIIVLKNFNPQYINPRTETELRITVKPNIKDIEPRRNQIILIDNELVLINLEQESYRIDQNESGSRFPY